MISIATSFNWCMAHRLTYGYRGKCRHLHGHNYRLVVHLTGEINDKGMVCDFKDVKQVIGNWIDKNLDHKTMISGVDLLLIAALADLNEDFLEVPFNTTVEKIIKWIALKLTPLMSGILGMPQIQKLVLFETDNNFCTWRA